MCLNVARDGEVNCAYVVIPFKGNAVVQFAFPVCGDLVERIEGPDGLIGVFLSLLFDAKVVYYKGDGYGAELVAPQAWHMRGW